MRSPLSPSLCAPPPPPPGVQQVLTADWCKYNDCIIATGSVDKTIKVWDVRAPQRELTTLYGHA